MTELKILGEMNDMYLIESMEHTHGDAIVWWKPDHCGYTDDVHEAGRYTKEQATKICDGANYGKTNPNDFNERMWTEREVFEGKAGRIQVTVMKR